MKEQVIRTANKAYDDFALQASEWLKENPDGKVTAMMTSFSRGGASAAIFSQLLWERGLIDPSTQKVLIPPGQVGVSAGLIYDPVDTGVSGNLAFAPNVKNVTVVRAENEYRTMFRGADYRGQTGVTTLDYTGNHCDTGGGYDNGLGALSLQAGTEFFRKTGLNIADVPATRQFDATKPVSVHTEGVDAYHHRKWTEDGSIQYGSTRLNENMTIDAGMRAKKEGAEVVDFTDVSGNTIELATRQDGSYSEVTHGRLGAVSEQEGDRHGAESSAQDFSIYGIDGKGNIDPAVVQKSGEANAAYAEQWLEEHGYQEAMAMRQKNTP